MLQALLLPVLIGQVPMPPVQAEKPAWIESLPEAPGRLYALGMADLGSSQSQAIARASDRARLAVVTRLRTTVKGQTSMVTRTSELSQGDAGVARFGDKQVRNTVNVTAQADNLPGLVVDRTYADPAGRSAYALAYLDLGQAQNALKSRLAHSHESRARVGEERSRKARWRLRKISGDLDRLEETMNLLALTGVGQDLAPALQKERVQVERQLAALDQGELPPLDCAKLAVGLRTNVDLPSGIETYLKAQIEACGFLPRDLAPELILDLSFTGGDAGPEFIFTDMNVFQGVIYHLELKMRLLEAGGEAIGRPAPIQIAQTVSPEGMVKEFRRQYERFLPKLFADFRNELQ